MLNVTATSTPVKYTQSLRQIMMKNAESTLLDKKLLCKLDFGQTGLHPYSYEE